jgi:hypothetical protein
MKYIKIDEKSYEVPESWSEISLDKFQKLLKSNQNKDLTPEETVVNTISVLIDCPVDVCRKIQYSDLSAIGELFAWAKEVDSVFDVEGKEVEDIVFNIDGSIFAFDKTFNITLGQNIDADNIMKDDANFYDNIHNLLAILLRPAKKRSKFLKLGLKSRVMRLLKKNKQVIKSEALESMLDYDVEQYDASKIEERAKLFKERLSAADAIRCAFFLSGLKDGLTKSIPGFGKLNLKEQEKVQAQNLGKGGLGIPSLDSMRMETLQDSQKS